MHSPESRLSAVITTIIIRISIPITQIPDGAVMLMMTQGAGRTGVTTVAARVAGIPDLPAVGIPVEADAEVTER